MKQDTMNAADCGSQLAEDETPVEETPGACGGEVEEGSSPELDDEGDDDAVSPLEDSNDEAGCAGGCGGA
jgi:hypothetical protein